MASRSPTDASTDDPRYRETQSGFLALRLVTEVRDDGLYVRFAPLHRSFRRIGVEAIDDVAVTTYDPAAHGGWHWGIRLGPTGKTTAYRLSGREGIRVTTTDGKRVFVGSDRPEALADAVEEILEGSR